MSEGRFELKYVLPVDLRDRIVDIVEPHTHPDPHGKPLDGGGTGYEVHSIYLDTPSFEDLFERLDMRKVRHRIRLRTYGRPGADTKVFLEDKRKLENRVVKHRVAVGKRSDWEGSVPDWDAVVARLKGRKKHAAALFRHQVVGRNRHPVSATHYEREIRVSDRNERITFDRRVQGSSYPGLTDFSAVADFDILPPGWMVMELKFAHTKPLWMRRICRELRLRAEPLSKFGLSVALGARAGNRFERRALLPRAARAHWTP